MSIEYIAPVTLMRSEAAVFRHLLAKAGECIVLPSSDDQHLKLRLVSNPPRSAWSEDIDIWLDNPIRVAVHAGTRQQREELIRGIEAVLKEMGHQVEFQED